MTFAKQAWWKKGTAYQIWPASYKDSNGDGIGDIPGVISTLDYLKDLGVDIVWLSPMYDSPQIDMGYDISDYQAIYPPFGTMDDMDKLIQECHGRGMKLILDLVINHTSDQHKWFQESKKDKTNPKADWYIWRDPKIVNGEKHPPNNWRSIFGGSAWEYGPERDQYYLHLFVKEQPDLNWEPDYVRKAIYKESIEYWLDKGIDGFRVDTVCIYSKDPTYSDAPIVLQDEPWQPAFHLFQDGPRIHEWLQEQRREVLDKYGDVFMVGEGATDNYDELLKYTGASRRELSCNFDFDVVDVGTNRNSAGKKHQSFRDQLPVFKKAFAKIQTMMMNTDCWGTVFMENHDQPRSLTRFATDNPAYREHAAKMLALMACCLSGTLFIYQGQEIGTYNHAEWPIEDIRDVDSLNFYNDICERYDNDTYWKKKALRGIRDLGRDNARLPVQWDASANAGFTTGKPWIRVHDDYANVNVADQQARKESPLNFWKTMLKFRKDYEDLCVFGDFEAHDMLEQKTFTYIKMYGERCEKQGEGELLVCCSFSDEEEPLDIPVRLRGKKKELVVGSYGGGEGEFLRPWEARVYLVKDNYESARGRLSKL